MTQKMARISSYLLEALASLMMMIHILETFSANIRYFASTTQGWKFTFKIEAAMKIFLPKMPKAIPQIRSKALLALEKWIIFDFFASSSTAQVQ